MTQSYPLDAQLPDLRPKRLQLVLHDADIEAQPGAGNIQSAEDDDLHAIPFHFFQKHQGSLIGLFVY